MYQIQSIEELEESPFFEPKISVRSLPVPNFEKKLARMAGFHPFPVIAEKLRRIVDDSEERGASFPDADGGIVFVAEVIMVFEIFGAAAKWGITHENREGEIIGVYYVSEEGRIVTFGPKATIYNLPHLLERYRVKSQKHAA